ncbi:5-(carboxyamino)imidazole ribonucleotide synthase [Membranicola marinus]|uniref:N5-carboxyaminoimidazole ribonucleotide synthase n=1 Tax=Membranihabitans marinus TaxID=1227546 RepID=A0A953HLW8_9BACT|nr:5-(carboxyamino)imidazole ribonucleotide synthase [Membranihabitans marinus]MBY5957499.1 5-(carboxyamino)imidazole ribonucleotide synthase [Membranihabitans marinus]
MKMEEIRIGILGGGQLGKMLNYTANQWNLPLALLDQQPEFPAGVNSWKFTTGDFKNYEDVMAFGGHLDILGIEIEHVNLQALYDLEAQGTKVHPRPAVLEIIKDKYLQNQFYRKHKLPTVAFDRYDNAEEIKTAVSNGTLVLPFVQKTRGEGYDGRGVQMVNQPEDLDKLLQGPSIVEGKVKIKKELAVVTARNEAGDIQCYDPVEMVFNDQNMLDFLYAPATIPEKIHDQLMNIAHDTMQKYAISGLMAIEFFWTTDDEILINEVAPRPHNSGHHTLENAVTNQFEQHLRGLLNLPLGDTKLLQPAAMLNILGEPDYTGIPVYHGMEDVLALDNVHIHIYGKPETRPYRKMGHVTVCGTDRIEIEDKIEYIKKTLKVITS